MHAQQMAATHPEVRGRANDALTPCIEACRACERVCHQAATATGLTGP
jgi:formate hydrogenlyase subunit 6/NADH:ubiquinone oxidoreductase subunit I